MFPSAAKQQTGSMTAVGAEKDMSLQIERLYQTNSLSDLTITCGGQGFAVHKIILYIQSEYFRKLLNGPFKEATTSTLEFPDDDPHVFRVLICYFYKKTLDTKSSGVPSRVQQQSESAFLIQVYAMADKYDVPRLRTLVVERLSAACDPQKDESDFIEALRVVDGCTAEDTIWNILIPKVKANLQALLKNEAFRDVVREQSALTFRLLDSFASGPRAQASDEFKSAPPVDSETPNRKRSRLSESEQQTPGTNSIPPPTAAPAAPTSLSQQTTSTPNLSSFVQGLSGQQTSGTGTLSSNNSPRGGVFDWEGRARARGRGRGS